MGISSMVGKVMDRAYWTDKKRDYLDYFQMVKAGGETPMTWAQWIKARKHKTMRTKQAQYQIRRDHSPSEEELSRL